MERPVNHPPTKKSSWKRWLIGLAIGLVSVLLLAALGCYLFPREILTVESGPVMADVLVVLGGGPEERSHRAAELFKMGEAPKILVSGTGDGEFNKQLLESNGVPAAVIMLECKSQTTLENARFSVPLLRAMGARRVIIVTSWYHSRRAMASFGHFAPDLQFYSRPSYFGYVPNTYQREHERQFMNTEFLKLLGYWVCYGVGPF